MEKQATECTHTSQKFVNKGISFVKSCQEKFEFQDAGIV